MTLSWSMNIIDCLVTVVSSDHNLLLSYRTATTNYPLLIIVAVLYCVTFFKNPLRVWASLHGNHAHMVFSAE